MNVMTRHVVISLLCMLFISEAAFAIASKDCQYLIQQTESWASEDKVAAVQVTFNNSSGNEGHVSLTDGYLSLYTPEDEPGIEELPKRGHSGVFQALPKFVMDRFEFENVSSNHSDDHNFPTERKNEIFLILLNNGEVFVISKNLGNTVLPVTNLQCFTGGFFDPGYYMTGFINEKDSTTLVSFVVRNVNA